MDGSVCPLNYQFGSSISVLAMGIDSSFVIRRHVKWDAEPIIVPLHYVDGC